ncbi:hypothetical protein Hdeb2414_s0001g00028961 [Helianthus debilis subsp. tardiflorus]
MDVDSAKALEKYVLDWSLVNKDRIVDALSAKMSPFHIGTPTKHFHYRKMSGLELGNVLTLSLAQSNSLVVETYKRWVEAESNCRRYEREVDVLKKQEGMSWKVKQEIALLQASVGRLKEQVLETKEINKASHASAAAAYNVRDKAIQDLEISNLKLQETQTKLSEVEGKWKSERHEMQIAYDKLLVDHIRLENGGEIKG